MPATFGAIFHITGQILSEELFFFEEPPHETKDRENGGNKPQIRTKGQGHSNEVYSRAHIHRVAHEFRRRLRQDTDGLERELPVAPGRDGGAPWRSVLPYVGILLIAERGRLPLPAHQRGPNGADTAWLARRLQSRAIAMRGLDARIFDLPRISDSSDNTNTYKIRSTRRGPESTSKRLIQRIQ